MKITRHLSLTTLFILVTLTLTSVITIVHSQTFTHPTDVAIMNAIAANYPNTFGRIPRWTVGTDPCTCLSINTTGFADPTWSGVYCDVINATAEPYYRVTAIQLRAYGSKSPLAGVLNGEIIPPEFGSLPRLYNLDLSLNGLQGSIPTFTSTVLISLNLGQNNLTGSIPASFSNLHKLKVLNLEINRLSGPVPFLPVGLQTIRLGANQLTGRISDFITNFTFVQTLSLQHNFFSGTLPAFQMNSPLSSLLLNNNNFRGSIHGSISYLRFLTNIDLGNNRLTGSVPSFVNTSAVYIRLSCNQLSGAIPDVLGTLPYLRSLKMEVNNLTGLIPTFLQSPPRTPLGSNGFGNVAIYFNASCNFFTPPLPMWCAMAGQNSSCVPCGDSERVCYNQLVPWTPTGPSSSSSTSTSSSFSSPSSRISPSSLLFFFSFFSRWLSVFN